MDVHAPETPTRETDAPAKVNLALHVVGRRADGYHELDSLVVFTREGDHVRMRDADDDGLELSGPFGTVLPQGRDNIVLRALDLARDVLHGAGRTLPAQLIQLRKALPPASGIGGGSADAAAVLRIIARRHPDLTDTLETASVRLGADVPMCLRSRSARVTGVGERIAALRINGPAFLLLVNPLVEVSTPAVFGRLARHDNAPMPPHPTQGFADHDALLTYLQVCRNDLARAACDLAPVIVDAVDAVRQSGASLSRMSGSGATVFGLFASEVACRAAERAIATAQPEWWVRATPLRTEELR